jgi:hypothetical protein
MSRVRHLTASITVAGALLVGCSPDSQEGAPIVSVTPASSPSVSSVTDPAVCASLAKVGKAFYERTYTPLMHSESIAASPIDLAAQLGALATTGATGGSIDGTVAISGASPDIREKLTRMVRDADRLAQHYADVARGTTPGSDLTIMVNTFTDGLIACTRAGYQPDWFDPESLVK